MALPLLAATRFVGGCLFFKDFKGSSYMDRRSGKDRRSNKIPEAKSLFIHGRRKGIRRKEDKYKIVFFDQYSSKIFLSIIVLLLLSITDALLTLILIGNGASEINPVMAYFLKFGPYTFISVKYFLTCYTAIIFLVFSNIFIRKLKIYVSSLLHYAIGVFSMVICWELYLFYRIWYLV